MIELKFVDEEKPVSLDLQGENGSGTKNYNELENKPTINGVELQGDLTLKDLGIIANAVKDILINGASIVDENGVAGIPMASANDLGLVKQGNGLYMANGKLCVLVADTSHIDKRSKGPVLKVENLGYAIKSAMCTDIDAEWSAEEKAMARERMGMEWTLIDTLEVKEKVAQVQIEFPQEYSEFMVIADISGTGSSVVYPIGGYFNADEPNHLKGYTLPFTDFYPSTNDEHYELVFEKMNIENDTFLKISGFESTNYAKKMKQNIQSTGWLQQYNVTNEYQCHCWYGVKFQRTITNATFKIFGK